MYVPSSSDLSLAGPVLVSASTALSMVIVVSNFPFNTNKKIVYSDVKNVSSKTAARTNIFGCGFVGSRKQQKQTEKQTLISCRLLFKM